MSEPAARVCASCAFWNPYERASFGEVGQCRRSPPILIAPAIVREEEGESGPVVDYDELLGASVWPVTYGDHWCGEYRVQSAQRGPPTVDQVLINLEAKLTDYDVALKGSQTND